MQIEVGPGRGRCHCPLGQAWQNTDRKSMKSGRIQIQVRRPILSQFTDRRHYIARSSRSVLRREGKRMARASTCTPPPPDSSPMGSVTMGLDCRNCTLDDKNKATQHLKPIHVLAATPQKEPRSDKRVQPALQNEPHRTRERSRSGPSLAESTSQTRRFWAGCGIHPVPFVKQSRDHFGP